MKCRRCPAEAAEGRKQCHACLAKGVEEAEARRAVRVAQGLCISCPAKATHGQRCAFHAAQNQARPRKPPPPDRCSKCGGPKVATGKLCALCILKVTEWQKGRRARNRAAGLCAKCNRPAVAGRTLCSYHRDLQSLSASAARERQSSQK